VPGAPIRDPRIVATVLADGSYEVSWVPAVPVAEAVRELRAIADRLERDREEDKIMFGEAT
jgi:hypothetical protein